MKEKGAESMQGDGAGKGLEASQKGWDTKRFLLLQHPGAGREPQSPTVCFHSVAEQKVMDDTGLYMLL